MTRDLERLQDALEEVWVAVERDEPTLRRQILAILESEGETKIGRLRCGAIRSQG